MNAKNEKTPERGSERPAASAAETSGTSNKERLGKGGDSLAINPEVLEDLREADVGLDWKPWGDVNGEGAWCLISENGTPIGMMRDRKDAETVVLALSAERQGDTCALAHEVLYEVLRSVSVMWENTSRMRMVLSRIVAGRELSDARLKEEMSEALRSMWIELDGMKLGESLGKVVRSEPEYEI